VLPMAICNVGVVSWKHAPPKRKRLLLRKIESLGMAASCRVAGRCGTHGLLQCRGGQLEARAAETQAPALLRSRASAWRPSAE